MGIEPASFGERDIDHILPVGAKDPDSNDRSEHPMNLFVMPQALNRSFGCRVSDEKFLYVGPRVWCAVLCWHELRAIDRMMQPHEAMELAHLMAASLLDHLLEMVKQSGALAAAT